MSPENLYVVADGPRPGNESDIENVAKTRAIFDSIDWDCKLVKDYSNSNLGCRKRVATGIENAFKMYDKAVILEDDCLPEIDFFYYCEVLLNKHQDNDKIMHISGSLFDEGQFTTYHFGGLPYIWGWATWRRAWEGFNWDSSGIVETKRELRKNSTLPRNSVVAICKILDRIAKGENDTWDYIWVAHVLKKNGICINPPANLIENIGFDERATHTTKEGDARANLPTFELNAPLVHPNKIELDQAANRTLIQSKFYQKTFFQRLMDSLKKRCSFNL